MNRTLRCVLALLLGLLALPALAQQAPDDPFRVEADDLTLPAGGQADLRVLLVVPGAHHVYRDMLELRIDQPGALQVGQAELPLGELEPDPAFPEKKREMYHKTVEMSLPLSAPADHPLGDQEIDVQVRYQGCKGSLCYLPRERSVSATVTVTAAQQGAHAAVEEEAHGTQAADMSAFGARPQLTDKEPVAVRAAAGEGNQVLVGFFQLEGWHVNKAMTSVSVAEGSPLTVASESWPEGHTYTDPVYGMERHEIGGDFIAQLTMGGPAGEQKVALVASYQACKAELCLMPRHVDLSVDLVLGAEGGQDAAAPSAQSAAPAAASGEQSSFEKMRDKGLIWLVLFVFGAGFLVSLTPCVLPMIPITMGIIGARASGSRLRAFSLSLTYVAGLALVYTALGVSSGVTGSLFGAWMQNIWVVGTVSFFFAAMGLAMFGLFDVALPSGMSMRLNQMGGAGYGGAFVVGMVGAIVAGPCSGPVVVSLMVLIGTEGALVLGAVLMLAFSLGMGVLFILAGTFSSAMLRPGAWMESVKHIFGVLMLLGAIYFIHAHLPDWLVALLASGVLLSTAVFGWPADEDQGVVVARAHKLYGVVAGLVGAWLLLALLSTQGFILPPLSLGVVADQHGGGGTAVVWMSDEEAALKRAASEKMPLIVDFTAEWCAACKELEHFTYTDERVVEASKGFVTLMIDATSSDDPVVKAQLERFEVKGLPTVLFLLPDGTSMDDLTITGFLKADAFLERMESARARVP